MKKKRLILLLCALLLAAILAGCTAHVCDYCGKTFNGKVKTGVNGNYELCKDCAEAQSAFFSGLGY